MSVIDATSSAVHLSNRRTRTDSQISPEWVRVSAASAIALQFRSGRFSRDFEFGGINLLLNYDDGCRSDCAYCGLARTRPGDYEDKSFIRVEWPLLKTSELVDRMAGKESTLTRLCISMVTSPLAYRDTVEITKEIRSKVKTPLSILVAPPTLNRRKLEHFAEIGVDMIGVGLDAVTEELFRSLRTDVPAGGAGLSWDKYWSVVDDARDIFGPWKVNCHTVVGLGESDADLIDMFYRLKEREIFPYLFCFNPEPDSRLGEHPKSPISRWRRIQLAKHLIEKYDYRQEAFDFDDEGALVHMDASSEAVEGVVATAVPFMTDGCPGENGEPGCTRPFGSYKPSEEFRDFPFLPDGFDLVDIRRELNLEKLLAKGEMI